MKRVLNFSVSLLVLGTMLYIFRSALLPAGPCEEPIRYALGNFDARFDISEKDFLEAVKAAEAVWEKPFGRELFEHSPDTEADPPPIPVIGEEKALRINLVYDHRQQATEKLKELGIAVEDTKNSYDALRTRYETLKERYDRDADAYEAEVGSFNERQREYNEEVQSWNDKGGAPKEEFERLERDRVALEAEAAELEKKRIAVNSRAEEVNALVVTLNRLARTLNLSVERYNTVSLSRGETFEEGLYSERGPEREIDIYEFADRAELVRVLAHELGHALSIGHVEDPEAIMYEYNESENAELTDADLSALESVCK